MILDLLSFAVAFIVAASTPAAPWADGDVGPAATVVGLVALFAAHRLYARRLLARIRIARESGAGNVPLRFFPIAATNLAFSWLAIRSGWTVGTLDRLGVAMGGFIDLGVSLLPWFTAHVSWLCARRPIVCEARGRDWPRGAYVTFHLRTLSLPAIPLLAITAIAVAGSRWPSFDLYLNAFPSVASVLGLALLLGLFAVSPFLVRLAVPTTSLSSGPLRARFEDLARRADFRYLDIRVCHTHGNILNAAFVGVLGRLRYVVFTDAILEKLPEAALSGVFAHEMGHSVRKHILYNVALFVAFSLSLQLLIAWAGLDDTGLMASIGLPLIGLPLFILFVYSPVARRFELEADVFAGTAVGEPGPILQALAAIGRLYPDKRKHGGLTHPGIDTRLDFLSRYFTDPSTALEFATRMRRLKRMILLLLGCVLLAWGMMLPGEIRRGSLAVRVIQVVRDDDASRARQVLADLETALAAGVVEDSDYRLRMWLWQTIGTALQDAGDYAKAQTYLEAMLAHRDAFTDPSARYSAAIIAAQQAAALGDWETFDRELERARKGLALLLAAVPGDPSLLRERRDLELLRAGRWVLGELGLLPPADAPGPLPQDGPWAGLIGSIVAHVRDGRALRPEALDPQQLERCEFRWKADFARRLAEAVSRTRQGASDGRDER